METEEMPRWEQAIRVVEARKAEQARLKKLPFTTCTHRSRSTLTRTKHGIQKIYFTELV